MKKSKRSFDLSCLSTLLFLSIAMVAIPQSAHADTVEINSSTSSSAPDAELARLGSAHAVSAVREAIAQVRQGQFTAAVPVLQEYALRSDIGATFVLAKLHQAGLGVEKSEEIAAGYLQANVDADHAPSLIALAEVQENSKPAEALKNYKKAKANGDLTGNLKLGDIYERGLLGQKANPKLAFSNYKKAAEANNPIGNYHLARCYDGGIGTSPNELLATRTFLKAAMQGVPGAQVRMARRYYEGKGLEKDPVAAFGWLTQASQKGSIEAMVLLGRRYEAGDIISQNLNLAGQWYSNAAKRGDPTGKYYLALLYANGKGTEQDLARAYVLLHDSAKSLPMAKEALDQLEPKLSESQLEEAKKKIAEVEANGAGNPNQGG